MSDHLWALVLAAGEGSRIQHLTTDAKGRRVPKQYASLNGDPSVLRKTLDRAERMVPRERVAVVVATHHQELWEKELTNLPPWNVIVQPRNRGTGLGLLLGLLHIRLRDPRCELLVLPSDHHVADEDALRESLLRAVEHSGQAGGRPTLLGVTPEQTDKELGWILNARSVSPHIRSVVGFVEKPVPSVARRLVSDGALINSMILAAGGNALLRLFQATEPQTVELVGKRLIASEGRTQELDDLYEALPTCDFSRDILEKAAGQLAVVPTRPCGWTDIGTPERLSRVLERHPKSACVA
ncbi:MAG: NTP transferase domain-containing protein [Acidobacteria bacterium]|nr:NTP transferase domain-containing protein [Acidobacteriota bacterium]